MGCIFQITFAKGENIDVSIRNVTAPSLTVWVENLPSMERPQGHCHPKRAGSHLHVWLCGTWHAPGVPPGTRGVSVLTPFFCSIPLTCLLLFHPRDPVRGDLFSWPISPRGSWAPVLLCSLLSSPTHLSVIPERGCQAPAWALEFGLREQGTHTNSTWMP